jgi:hypothetical protein
MRRFMMAGKRVARRRSGRVASACLVGWCVALGSGVGCSPAAGNLDVPADGGPTPSPGKGGASLAPSASPAPAVERQRLGDGSLRLQVGGTTHYYRPFCDERDTTLPACTGYVETDSGGTPMTEDQPGPGRLTAADLQAAYGIPTYLASNPTIAIIGYSDSPNFEQDLATYRSTFGLPPCTSASGCFTIVNESGNPAPLPSVSSGWAMEETLDIEMASAACPTCKILLLEAYGDPPGTMTPGSHIVKAITTAAKLGAVVASFSGGQGELPYMLGYDAQLAATGIGLFGASGDNGWLGGVIWPSTSKAFTAVGGTVLTPAPGTYRGWQETAWAGAYIGSQSGCSAIEAKPAWQTDTGCSNRTVADVSAVAHNVWQFYTPPGGTSVWEGNGGTSVGTPLVAGIYALTGIWNVGPGYSYPGQPGGSYAGNFFNDVTTGSQGACGNYLCTAGPGYDGPTGNGTPWGPFIAKNGPLGSQMVNWGMLAPTTASLVQFGGTTVTLTQDAGGNPSFTPAVLWNLPAGVTATSSCSAWPWIPPPQEETITCTISLQAAADAAVGSWTVPVEISIAGAPLFQNLEIDVTPCTPATQCTGGATCGAQPDGCGGSIVCGTCSAGSVCHSGSCCTPQTQCAPGQCGPAASDGCGGTLSCGGCAAGQTCYAGSCCSPQKACLTGDCGEVDDGCGGTLSCSGACPVGTTCGGGGIPNVCGKQPPIHCKPGTCM